MIFNSKTIINTTFHSNSFVNTTNFRLRFRQNQIIYYILFDYIAVCMIKVLNKCLKSHEFFKAEILNMMYKYGVCYYIESDFSNIYTCYSRIITFIVKSIDCTRVPFHVFIVWDQFEFVLSFIKFWPAVSVHRFSKAILIQ